MDKINAEFFLHSWKGIGIKKVLGPCLQIYWSLVFYLEVEVHL